LWRVNCAAIPTELLESELFGHERGAFTGGRGRHAVPAVQEQEFERVGGNRTTRVDVQIVAATNRDLKAMVDENRFRAGGHPLAHSLLRSETHVARGPEHEKDSSACIGGVPELRLAGQYSRSAECH
jgi:hypothetical protein